MNLEDVFLAALDQLDAKTRNQYLEGACNGDSAVRRQVDELLAAHFRSGEFLNVPAIEQVRPNPDEANTVTVHGESSTSREHDTEELGFLEPATRPDSLGRIGHYEVLQVLGQGGFGIVFRAFDEVLHRVVAVKVLAPHLASTSPARKRFLREARTSAAVRHENVVQVYEVGEQPLPYIVMEFIPGETLQQWLDRNGPVSVADVLRIGRQLAEGLAAAHATDLIHRDIKPANVLLEGGAQRVKITDFGLARAADDASISQSGIIAGTPMYMAPEQAKGETLDQRADLFSLGSVLYQMAAGRSPFRATGTLAVLKRVAEDTPRPIREIIPETPQWLCDIITKLHAKNPDDRYQSAREVADVLADCEAQLKANAKLKDYSRIPRSRQPVGRKSELWKWALAAALLLPVVTLALAELSGVTHLFQSGAMGDLTKPGDEPTPIQVAKQESLPAGDWVPLFNGKDLTGWRPHSQAPGDWGVEDGVIVGRGDTSFLFNESKEYDNFHLRVEAKINTTGDSGILFRVPFDVRVNEGYEAQIAVRSNYPVHTGSLSSRADPSSPLQRARQMPHRPDVWFVLEVIADGNHLQTRVNGLTTAEYREDKQGFVRGHIALQTWGRKITFVQFRKIEIKELQRTIAPSPDAKAPPIAKQEPLPPTFKNGIGMEFVVVPKGKSWLGGGKDKLGDKEVEIPADFYLGKYEVTQEEWTQVTGENPSHFSRTRGGKDAVKDISDADLKRFPVENVSWDDCQLFVAKLNQREKEKGWVYRLPTEAEWEYACRGGPMADKTDSAFDYYFAKPTNTLLPEQANFNAGLNRTSKVGSYEPNRLGLFDMHGNVTEYCDDAEKVDDGALYRVVRGGNWTTNSDIRQATWRFVGPPSGRNLLVGLRLARVPSGAPSPAAKTPPDTKPTVEVAPPAPTAHDTWLKATALLPLDQHAAALPAKLKVRLPGFDDAMLRTIPSLVADRQAIMVAAWLRDRNPDFDGEITHKIEGGVLTSLEVPSPLVQDLTPLRALPGLRTLTGRSTLGYDNLAARDAALLQALKTLETINGKPVAQFWKDAEAKQAEFKEWLQLVPTLTAPQQVAAVVARLKERNPGFDGTVEHKIKGGVVTELTFTPFKGQDIVTDLSPVRALAGLTSLSLKNCSQVQDLSPLKDMPLTYLNLYGCNRVRDLEPLKGMPLTYLSIRIISGNRAVTDLSALKGMPLTVLSLNATQVQDFSPLKGMPLTRLELHSTQLRDLELLKGMPLKRLGLHGTGVTDLTPLQGMELEQIYLTPKNITQGLNILRDMKSLKTIGIEYNQAWPAAEFWERYDKGEFKAAIVPPGAP